MATHEEITTFVCNAIVETCPNTSYESVFGNKELSLIGDLKMESLHAMVITSSIEDEFDIQLNPETLLNSKTVNGAIAYVLSVVDGN